MERPRYPYDVVRAPEGISTDMVWVLGADARSSAVCEAIGYRPSPEEIGFVTQAVQREAGALASLKVATGRNAVFDREPVEILGLPYDAVQISGFGYQAFQHVVNGFGVIDPSQPLGLPTADNFVTRYPEVTQTRVVSQGREEDRGDAFSFTGAYTKKQALFKVAANLGILEAMTDMGSGYFIVPIPIALGTYPSIRNDEGDPAYFIAFRVPYNGQRQGIFAFPETAEERTEQIENFFTKTPKVARALRDLHEKFRLAHNQPNAGNYLAPSGQPMYLADFSTIQPIEKSSAHLSRANDLRLLILSGVEYAKIAFRTQEVEEEFMNRLFYSSLRYYLGHPPVLQSVPRDQLLDILYAEIKQASHEGRLRLSSNNTWDKIKAYEAMLESTA